MAKASPSFHRDPRAASQNGFVTAQIFSTAELGTLYVLRVCGRMADGLGTLAGVVLLDGFDVRGFFPFFFDLVGIR